MVLSVTVMLVDLSAEIMQVTVSVAIIQIKVSAALIQVPVSATNMWVTIFIVIMHKGVCFNYAGGIFCSGLGTWQFLEIEFYCNYAGDSFLTAMR